MLESIRAASPEEFAHQLQEYSGITQAMLGFTLLPPSFENDEGRLQVANLDNSSLRRIYKSRMEIFDAMHQSQIDESVLEHNDIKKMQNTLQILNNLDTYIENHQQGNGEKTLRGRQFNAFEDLRNFIEAGETDGYIKLPTGVGKTVLFTEVVEATDVRTLILVPTIDLVHQTEEKFQSFASEIELGKVYGAKKDFSKKVTVITYDSLLNQIKNGNIKPEEYGLLILDEDHKSYSPMRSIEIEKFKDSIKLGFTATPNPNTTRKEIHSMTIKEAVEEGLLADFRVWIAQTDIDLSNITIDHGKYDEKQLEKALNVAKRNKAAIDLYKQRFEGQSTLAFCVSIQHAKDLAEQMRMQGINAVAVHGGMNGEERKKILQQFRDGNIDVICNVDILVEGFDAPNASVCLNLSPTFSPIVAEQRGGRVLRLDKNNPDKEAIIIDFIDKDSREKSISFADIVGSSFVEKKKGKSSGGGTSGPVVDNPKISIEGLTVITDVEEVMRLTKSKSESTMIPEGFFQIPISELEIQFQIPYSTLKDRIYKLRGQYPDEFRKFNRFNFATQKGLELITEALSDYIHDKNQIPKENPLPKEEEQLLPGFSYLDTAQIGSEYNVPSVTMWKYINRLTSKHPDKFTKGSKGKNYATEEGRKLLLNMISAREITLNPNVPENFAPISPSDLSSEFNLSKDSIRAQINLLREERPDLFTYVEGKSTYGSVEGLELLKDRLTKRKGNILQGEFEKFKEIPATQIATNNNVGETKVYNLLKELAQTYPEHFYTRKPGLPWLMTDEGYSILQQRLSK